MLVLLTPHFQNACHHLRYGAWCDIRRIRVGLGLSIKPVYVNGSPLWVERSQSSFQFHMRKPLKEVRNEPFGHDVADSFLPSKSHESFFAVTDNEKRRLQDAFRRSSAANNNISKQVQAIVKGIGSPSKNHRFSLHGHYSSLSLGFISLWIFPCWKVATFHCPHF